MFKYLFSLVVCTMMLIGCGVDKDTTLSSLRQEAFEEFVAFNYKEDSDFKANIKEAILDYTKANNIEVNISKFNNFTNCVMYNIWEKSPNQALALPLQVCTNELNNGELDKINYEDPSWILGQLDTINGEHYIASKYIKNNINDPESYEFVNATYNILQNGAHVVITTEYIAKNLLGGNTRNKTTILFSNRGEILAVY